MNMGNRPLYDVSGVNEATSKHTVSFDVSERHTRVRRSALWAAYGDALGWISELTDASGLKRRTGGPPLREPIAWKRRIGGRAGVTASLPKGCYSDDSQLRLATSRAIRPDGFDVEAFAKVELPVWLSYALGGGRSTSVAATRLGKPRSSWFANSFKGWTASGGNGAAMRVQPHVWAARTPEDPKSFIPDVVRNTICTHSHPRGLMGAVLHALSVARAISTGNCPSPRDLQADIDVAERLPAIMNRDTELRYWLTAFERDSGSFNDAWAQAITEARVTAQLVAESTAYRSGPERYKDIVDSLDLRNPTCRGSGTLTTMAAVGLTWCETRPVEAMRIAANALGTDTDTIATMAGAILGATDEADPPIEVLDAELFRTEADRLTEIASGRTPSSHQYPDLLHWSAPKTRADALVQSDGIYVVRGLGRVAETPDEPLVGPKGKFQWQWIKLESGQTLLIKRRPRLAREIVSDRPSVGEKHENVTDKPAVKERGRGNSFKPPLGNRSVTGQPVVKPTRPAMASQPSDRSVAATLSLVEEHINDDKVVGRALRIVVRKGTRGEIHEFTGKLIDLLRDSGMS